MKYFFTILFAFGLLTSTSIYSQVLNDSGQHGKMLLQTKKGNSLNSIQGTPFLNENFQKGTVTLKGNEVINVLLRYDVLNEDMEIRTGLDDEEIYLLPQKEGTEYTIGEENFRYRTLNNGEQIKGYFREHYKGEKVEFLEKISAVITDPVKAQTGYQKDRPARIVLEEKYFLLLENGEVKEVKLKTKDFIKALPDSKAVRAYLSENKVKTIEDYKEMLEWYDNKD